MLELGEVVDEELLELLVEDNDDEVVESRFDDPVEAEELVVDAPGALVDPEAGTVAVERAVDVTTEVTVEFDPRGTAK